MITPNTIVINDANAHLWVNPKVDGETKKCGTIPRPHGVDYADEHLMHSVDMPQIDPSDFPKLIKELDDSESSLWHFRMKGNGGQMVPSRDQNGKGYSHTADTEVLTENGWVKWPDYNGTDLLASVNPITHLMEFQAPTERHGYEYKDEMYYSTNRRLDFGVTHNHRMYVRKWDERLRTLSKDYSFVPASRLGWYCELMASPKGFIGTDLVKLKVEGDREYSGDDFLAMVSLVVSDGWAGGSESSRNTVEFCCFREDRHSQVDFLAHRIGFKESTRRGVWRRNAPALAAWIRANCYTSDGLRSPNKCVPGLVKYASMRQIKHFLSWFGDQNHGKDSQKVFYSSSKRLMDDLQELHLRIGERGTITKKDPRTATYDGKEIKGGVSYVMCVGEIDRLCIDRKKHIETDRYNGLVYCATVPNGILITRRNGSILISGNCWAHSGTSAHLLIRARDDMPYADLSAYAIACQIKNFADEGGWGAQGLDWQMKNGVPTSATWPQQSMSRSNVNDTMKADALKHRITEGWIDVGAAQYDRNLTFNQMITCLLSRVPVIVDFNWWSHSVCAIKVVNSATQWKITRGASGKLLTKAQFDKFWGMNDPVTGGINPMIWNSWGDSWSEQGCGILVGNKGVPDGAVAPRVATWSLK